MITLTVFAPVVITGTIIARIILAAAMLIGGVGAIILVMLQKGNSDGTSALSGGTVRNSEQDVESFYGKNKGLRRDSRLKLYTWICTALVTVCSIVFFILGL